MYTKFVRSIGSLFLMLLIVSGGIFPVGAAPQLTTAYNLAQFLPVDDGAIYDYSPFDGVGDIVDHEGTVVAILNQGILETRGAMEFDLSSIPPGSIIESATLNVVLIGRAGTGSIPVQVFGYEGNGTIEPSDFGIGSVVTIFDAWNLPFNVPVPLDVTGFLQGQFPVDYIGFTLRTNVHASQANFGSSEFIAAPFLTIQYSEAVKEVSVDIKPGSDTNPINPNSNGNIPVAILSNPDYDALSMVDVTSLTFGRSGNEESLAFCNENGEDVNGDGLPDLVCHFDTQLTLLTHPKFRYGNLKGLALDGTPLKGQDVITILD